MTVLALACCVVTGVTLAGVFGRGNVLMVRFSAAPLPPAEAEPTEVEPVANRARKTDRLPVATQVQTAARDTGEDSALPEPRAQEVTTDVSVDAEILPAAPVDGPPLPRPRPRLANQLVQKNYSLLSDMQIAALKERLQLTAAQQPYWPAVESALRDVARKIHERRAAPGRQAAFSPADIEQIKVAAQPLLSRLREEQKREARSLARIIGLEAVASLI